MEDSFFKHPATPIQWRKKLERLAELTPDAFVLLRLNNENCDIAVSGQPMPQFKGMDTTKLYFLADNRFVYGVFQIVKKTPKHKSSFTGNSDGKAVSSSTKQASSKTNEEIAFNNLTDYKKPVPLQTNAAAHLLLQELKKRNPGLKEHAFFLKVSFDKNNFHAAVASKYLPGFVENYFNEDKTALKELQKISQQINFLLNADETQQQNQILKKITLLGGKLGKLIPLDKMLRNALKTTTEIYVNNESDVPLQAVNYMTKRNGQQTPFFPLIESPTVFFNNTKKINDDVEHSIVRSLCVLNLLDDKNAQKESQQILKCLDQLNKSDKMPILFQNTADNIENLFANYDFLHVIAHGDHEEDKNKKDYHLRNSKQKSIVSLQQLKKFSRMPQILFLSVCGSNHREIVQHFFKNNGHTLIVFDGLLFNQGIEKHIGIFYTSLFKGNSIKSAFFAMQTKMLSDLNPNCYRIKLYGATDEIFFVV